MKSTQIGWSLLVCGAFGFSGATARAESPAGGIDGTWKGTLAGTLRLVLSITREGGAYAGILDSVDQGATIPIDVVAVEGSKVRLDVRRVGGTYEGVLNRDGSRMEGTWTQAGVAQPLSFAKERLARGAKPTAKRAGPPPIDAPLDIAVPAPPTAFRADGAGHLVYELHVTNFSREAVSLVRVVARGASGNVLARLDENELAMRASRPGLPGSAGLEKLKVGPGLRVVVYMWITLGGAGAVPSALDHDVTVAGEDQTELTAHCARVAVGADAPVFGPPLRGGGWLAGNGPSNTSGHRRALIPVNGRAYIAQRFAIDWVRVGPDGKSFTGDPKSNKNYRAYGVSALAVADGVVIAAKDGIRENVPGLASRAVPITLDTVAGNYVIIEVGRGRYAFYAHFQPGTLRVKVGDRVRRGQVLGLVGNSGNSTEPHLHFHLSDASSPLGAEGIPYVFDSFESKPADGKSPEAKRSQELPTEGQLVAFP